MYAWALGLGLAAGCLLELQATISCGDGYVDRAAGEECDPEDEASFAEVCSALGRPGLAECDPVDCTLRAGEIECGRCGDGIVDSLRGEACDGSVENASCPSGEGRLGCTAECEITDLGCEQCGDGELDPGEECDDRATIGGLIDPRPCAGSDLFEFPVVEPILAPVAKGYASGTVASCRGCRWDRSACGYCGDGELDLATALDFEGGVAQAEVCDEDRFDPAAIAIELPVLVAGCEAEAEATGLGLRPNVTCGPTCRELVHPPEDVPCCRTAAEPCPATGEPIPCCHASIYPGEPACDTFTTPSGGETLVLCL